MTTPFNESESADDKELDDYLSGRSALSRRYRAEAEAMTEAQPPASLDRAVLTQAHAAVKRTAPAVVTLSRRKTVRWVVPFAAAATVVLSFAIFREAGMDTGLVPQEAPVAASAPLDARHIEESDSLEMSNEAARLDDAGGNTSSIGLPKSSRQPQTAAGAASGNSSGAGLESSAKRPSESLLFKAPPELLRNSAVEEEVVPAASPAVPALPAPATASTSKTVVEPPHAGAPAADAAKRDANQRLPATRTDTPAGATARPYVLKQEAAGITAVRERAASELKAAAKPRPPAEWLESIRKLRADGKATEADAELKRFLQAYPDYFEKNPEVARP